MSITEARKRIFELAEDVQTPGVHFTLTEKGKARVVLMSVEEFEGWMETMDILAEDPHIVQEIVETIRKINYGEVVITVHDSKVVQIEKKEKKRFN